MPPIDRLLTIEAATRLGSFKRAAAELGLTPSAVSHRVRAVEQNLGKLLFERVGQGVRPTDQARGLAQVIAQARIDIEEAWGRLAEGPGSSRIRMGCMAGFASGFITPRLAEFKRRFPAVDLELTSHGRGSGLRARCDVLLGFGDPPPADWWSEDLMPLRLRPVVAPGRMAQVFREGALVGPLLGYARAVRFWPRAAQALDLPLHPDVQQIAFDSIESACAAAEAGVGVALAPTWIAEQRVREGRLTALGPPVDAGGVYWLAIRKDLKDAPVFQALRRWLVAVGEA